MLPCESSVKLFVLVLVKLFLGSVKLFLGNVLDILLNLVPIWLVDVDKIVQADRLRSSFAQNSHHVPQQLSLCEEILVASSETYVATQLQILVRL